LLLGSLALAGPATAVTKIATTTTCGNGLLNAGGQGLICRVTVVNRITASGGGSAKVTVRECSGAAGAPTAICATKVTNLKSPVTAVNQCNGSINGGGGTLRCSVQVINNFVGLSTGATRATVNQCVGSGSITTGCDPFPATTTGATITQCNGSANGGTLVGLTCTATGTKSSALAVKINQCNGSANGGGALVICSASIANKAVVGSSRLTYTGPTTATPGAMVTLSAKIRTSTGAAIAGASVTFTFNGVTRSAKTRSSGNASVVIAAPSKVGNYRIRIATPRDRTHAPASLSLFLRVATSGGLPNTSTLPPKAVPESGPAGFVLIGTFLLALVGCAWALEARRLKHASPGRNQRLNSYRR
jgi:hypothetical protein